MTKPIVAKSTIHVYTMCIMRKKIIIPVVATLLTLVINSCAPTTPAKRIKKSPAVFEQLSPSDQELAKQGQIKEGMEKNAVLIALGQPSRVNAGSKDGVPFEKWFYTDATQAYNSVSYGHVGFGADLVADSEIEDLVMAGSVDLVTVPHS